jgi:hypothetical protein
VSEPYGKGLSDAALDNMRKLGVKKALYEGVSGPADGGLSLT